MNQSVHHELHWVDEDSNPAGGYAAGVGYAISWQNGPVAKMNNKLYPNGVQVEDILEISRKRLEFLQEASDGKFACSENERAIFYIQKAIDVLNERTARRTAAGIEGKHIEN